MRILFLHSKDCFHLDADEEEKMLLQLFSKFALMGNTIVVLSSAYKDSEKRKTVDGVTFVQLGRNRLMYKLFLKRQIRKLDAEFHFDVVVECLESPPLFAARRTEIPSVVVVSCLWHGCVTKENLSFRTVCGWLKELSISNSYRKSVFVAASPSIADTLNEIGIPQSKISLVFCGTNSIPRNIPAVEKKRYFLWISADHKITGIYSALEAFEVFSRRHPNENFLLRVVGLHTVEKSFVRELYKRGLGDRVLIETNVSEERRMTLLREAFCVLQTNQMHGWSFTVIDAGKCGTVSIVEDFPGLRDSVRDGVTGFLYSKENGAANCLKQMEILFADDKLRENMQTNARRYAESFYLDRFANELFAVLQKVTLEK